MKRVAGGAPPTIGAMYGVNVPPHSTPISPPVLLLYGVVSKGEVSAK